MKKFFPQLYPATHLGKKVDRQALVNAFQELDAGQVNNVVKDPAPGILIGTTKVMGTGLNCPRAFRMFLMEPQLLDSQEKQCFARIRRTGQKNAETIGYRLTTPDLDFEKQIDVRKGNRGKLITSGIGGSSGNVGND